MRKYIKDIIIAIPGLLAVIERWGGRVMDLIGLPEAAKQIERLQLEYIPDVGAGTYWLIAFSVIGVLAVHFWPKKDVLPKHPEATESGKQPEVSTPKTFIRARNVKGLRVEGSTFIGDRTHIDADGAADINTKGNIHRDSDDQKEK